MEVSEVKGNLGKEVFYRINPNEKFHKYILSAYIFRIHAKNSEKRLKQVELQDISSQRCVIIAPLDEVKLKL